MGNIITFIIVALLAICCFFICIMQFRKKGFCLNTAYLLASKQEREKMDKKPHYKQSGVVFAFLTGIFLCLAVEIMTETGWLIKVMWLLVVFAIIYAIASSVKSVTKR